MDDLDPIFGHYAQQQTKHCRDPVIASQPNGSNVTANQIVEPTRAKIPNQKLQTGIRGQSRLRELDAKIALDGSSQKGFSISHGSWPFVWVESCVCHLFLPTTKGLFASMNIEYQHYL